MGRFLAVLLSPLLNGMGRHFMIEVPLVFFFCASGIGSLYEGALVLPRWWFCSWIGSALQANFCNRRFADAAVVFASQKLARVCDRFVDCCSVVCAANRSSELVFDPELERRECEAGCCTYCPP